MAKDIIIYQKHNQISLIWLNSMLLKLFHS